MNDREQQKGQGRRRAFVICHLTFLILSLLLLWPVVMHPTWWLWKPGAPHSDLAVTHWPNAHFTRRTLWKKGCFPLWRPTIMSGTPFAANPLAALYYPLNWVFLFGPLWSWLSLEVGFNLSALAHLWLAGAAMYALMRRGFGVQIWGALTAAVAYEASPKLLAHLGAGHVGWAQAWAWLPLVILCVWRVCRSASEQGGKRAGCRRQDAGCGRQDARIRRRFVILGGAALAMQFCADVRMAAYTLVAGCSLFAARCWALVPGCRKLDIRTLIRHGSLFIASLLIASGLSACQWVPTVALVPDTTRASMTLSEAAVWSLPWRYLLGLFVANHGGFHEWMTYAGVSTLILAWIGGRAAGRDRERRWLTTWLIGLAVLAAWFSLGENGGLFNVSWHLVPGMKLLRVPSRAWVLVVFSTAALAGFGVEKTQRRQSGLEGRERVLLLAVGAFPPFLAVGYWALVGTPPLSVVTFGIVTPLAVALISFRFRGCKFQAGDDLKSVILQPETLFGLAAVLLVAIDLLLVDATLLEARPPETVFADGRAVAEWLSDQPGRFRIYSPSYSIPQHVAELYGLELADGVDPLQLRAYANYLTRAAGLEPQEYSVTLPPFSADADVSAALKHVTPNAEMLGRLGVRYVAAAFPIAGCRTQVVDCKFELVRRFGDVYVYQNEEARPPKEGGDGSAVVLADDTVLYRYRSWPVYAGWVVSAVTMIGAISWAARPLGKRGFNG